MQTPTLARPNYQHHWVIEEANGPTSAGVCRSCNGHREFQNWLPDPEAAGIDKGGYFRRRRVVPLANN